MEKYQPLQTRVLDLIDNPTGVDSIKILSRLQTANIFTRT